MDKELKRRIEAQLKRVAIHALSTSATAALVGIAIATAPTLYLAHSRGELTAAVAFALIRSAARLGLDLSVIAAFLDVAFLQAVTMRRAAGWIAVGMLAGSLIGAVLTFSVEISAWTTAYMIGGAVIGLVATCVRLWGAERASRGHPVKFGTLLGK